MREEIGIGARYKAVIECIKFYENLIEISKHKIEELYTAKHSLEKDMAKYKKQNNNDLLPAVETAGFWRVMKT